MFPNANDSKSGTTQSRVDAFRSLRIQDQFLAPVVLVGCGKRPFAGRALMPEATVHKNDEPRSLEREVWLSGKCVHMQAPAPDTSAHQGGSHSPFGRSIVLRANERHPSTAFVRCESIHASRPIKSS